MYEVCYLLPRDVPLGSFRSPPQMTGQRHTPQPYNGPVNHSQFPGAGPGQRPMGTMPPRPGVPQRPPGMQRPPTPVSMSQGPPNSMGGGMPPNGPFTSTGQMGGPPRPMMGHPPMMNSMPPKQGMVPLMAGAPPTSRPQAPQPMVNGVPSSQPGSFAPGQPLRPFLNGPPTSGPPTSMNGPPPRPGPPLSMGPQTNGPPGMRPGQTPPVSGPYVGQRPPGPPPNMMGGVPMGRGALPPVGPPQGSLLPGGLPPPPSRMNGGAPPQGGLQPGQQSGGNLLQLPVPFRGQGQYAHNVNPGGVTPGITPTNSEPVSQKSSRAPSPTPGNTSANYDALEGGGQATLPPWMAPPTPETSPTGPLHPMGQTKMVSPMPTQPPMPGQQYGQPPMPGQPPMLGQPHMPGQPPMPGQMPMPGQPPLPGQPGMPPAPPTVQDMQRTGGIMGKRHYPQMTGLNAQVPPPPMSGAQPGAMPGQMNNRMGGQPQYHPQPGQQPGGYNNGPVDTSNMNNLGSSFNSMKLGAQPITTPDRPINLMQERVLIPPDGVEQMKPALPHDFKKANVNPEIFRCTLSTLPVSQSLLNKSRLPLGILIHPFKDLSQLPVIQSSVIVRCRSCRTYINPFVTFVDMRKWKCNLCFRINELPDEFNYDPVSKTYGDPQRRPEIRSATIEFIAPSEYMLRPPQPAVYLYVLDVSFNAVSTGYLNTFCQTLLDELDRIPGDSRTHIGFISFDSSLHFYNLSEGLSQPQMLVVSDVDDIFLPCPDSLLVNLHESKELITELLNQLPSMFENTMDTGNALGAALQAAYKLMGATGGRVSVFQTQLPNVGPGALKNREDPNERAGKKVQHLGPATDFYKKMSLDCSAQQIAVDLFLMSTQYADLASIGCISKYSGGSINYFPGLHATSNPAEMDRLEGTLRRYFTRKIGFEAVMRIRCTRGLSIHTFHGNFFVRSTDLLSLPNINPDAGFGMQMSIEDTLETNTACFQAALLYTSSKGERRIRVHTMCLPVTNNLSAVYTGADQLAIVGLLAKMAVDKCVSQSLSDARDAMINASIDMLGAYGQTLAAAQRVGQLPVCFTLRLMPMYAIAMLKYLGFRLGTSTKLDDRVFALEQCKTLPLCFLLLELYPALYPVHALDDKVVDSADSPASGTKPTLGPNCKKLYFYEQENALSKGDSQVPQPPRLQLSSAHIDRHGAYLMDAGSYHCLWIGGAISDRFCQEVFDVPNYAAVQDGLTELPELENPTSERLRSFIGHQNDQRPFPAGLYVIRDDSIQRMMFLRHMVEDRTESTMSYYEFLQHLQKEVKS